MTDSSNAVVPWQNYFRAIAKDEYEGSLKSAGSGTEYSPNQIVYRFEEEIEMMDDGVHPGETATGRRPLPRIADDEGNYVFRDSIDKEWYDLTTSEDGYDDPDRFHPFRSSNSSTFTNFLPNESGPKPHQGWKIRVAAYPDEAREVTRSVLPYLRENDLSHKVVQDVHNMKSLEGSRQEGKLITIYPEIDSDRQDVIMEDGVQQFEEEDPSWNMLSINSNTKNARQIIEDLESELSGSEPGLEGRKITGKNGEEKQYKNTRIHFRYAHHFRTPAEITEQDGNVKEVGHDEGLVDQNGDLILGSYIGDQIESATRPDEFL